MNSNEQQKEYRFKNKNFENAYRNRHFQNRKNKESIIINSKVLNKSEFQSNSEIQNIRLKQFKVIDSEIK